jgi:hypothetical protein
MAMSFFNAFNLPVTIARPFNTYGPRQSARAVIPTIITPRRWPAVSSTGCTSRTPAGFRPRSAGRSRTSPIRSGSSVCSSGPTVQARSQATRPSAGAGRAGCRASR